MGNAKYPESGGAYRGARNQARVDGEPITQEALAAKVRVSPRSVKRWEHGEARPWPSLRDRIAAYLEVDPSTLPAAGEDPFDSSHMSTITPSSHGFMQRFGGWFKRNSK